VCLFVKRCAFDVCVEYKLKLCMCSWIRPSRLVQIYLQRLSHGPCDMGVEGSCVRGFTWGGHVVSCALVWSSILMQLRVACVNKCSLVLSIDPYCCGTVCVHTRTHTCLNTMLTDTDLWLRMCTNIQTFTHAQNAYKLHLHYMRVVKDMLRSAVTCLLLHMRHFQLCPAFALVCACRWWCASIGWEWSARPVRTTGQRQSCSKSVNPSMKEEGALGLVWRRRLMWASHLPSECQACI